MSFQVQEGIFLGHTVSRSVIEVDKAKVGEFEKLPPPVSVKCVRSLLGHADALLKISLIFLFPCAGC